MRTSLKSLWYILTAPFRLVIWIIKKLAGGVTNVYRQLVSFFTEEPQDDPFTDSIQKVVESPRDLLPHINELRKHLFRAIIFLFITTALSFSFANQILTFLARPLPDGVESIQAIEVTEPISVLMRISLLSGFAVALPYIILELILFAAPGLHRKTRVYLVMVGIPSATLLFVGGMAFAYYVMLPVAVPFLLTILNFEANIRASSYIKFVTGVMFWIGVVFQLPLVIFVIARLGLVRASTLAKQWRLAVVFIAIVSAAITPTIDPINMSIVMVPLILLYFFSVGLAFLAQRGRYSEQT